MGGVSIIGSMADTRGRKRAYLWSVLILQTGAFISMMAPFYSFYALGRLVTGFGVGGMGLTVYVLNAELVGKEMRPYLLVAGNCAFALGCLFVSPLSMWVQLEDER